MTQDPDREAHESRIRERAYALWEDAGRPEGGAEDYWHQAEREVGATPPKSRSRNGPAAGKHSPDEGPAGAAPAAKKAKPARRTPTTGQTGTSAD